MLRDDSNFPLVDVSDIFYFFLLGEGEGRVRGAGRGGGLIFIENPRRGGGLQEGRGRGAGRVSAANWGIWRGGAKFFFFRGRNVHQVLIPFDSQTAGELCPWRSAGSLPLLRGLRGPAMRDTARLSQHSPPLFQRKQRV